MTEDAATRLGRLIRERRKSLNLTQADIQAAGGPSTATLRLIEGGKHTDFRPSTSQPLEKALHWAPGSISEILTGKSPSVSGAIRGRSGLIETFTAVEGGEQANLRRLRLAAIIMDARELVQSQPGPLMTALASILDEAADLVIKVIAEDDDDVADARWRIDQVRAGNSIRRQGSVYVADEPAHANVDLPEPLLTVDEGNEEQLLAEALLGHYVEMFLRAFDDGGSSVLVQQARNVLGTDVDQGRLVEPEIADGLYAKYIAARHTAIQGGLPEAHAATELTVDQREAANARYLRERSEMILFDGHIRTAGAPAAAIAEALHRVAPPGYTPGQPEQGDVDGEDSQDQ